MLRYSKVSHWHIPITVLVVASGGDPLQTLQPPLAPGLANISHNLVMEEFWTCGPYNTANGEHLEYFLLC